MPPAFRIVGFARREKTDDSWREELRAGAGPVFANQAGGRRGLAGIFAEHIFYCQGDLTDAAAYRKLEKQLTSFGSEPLRQNLLFYLATLPSQFGQVVEQLHRAGLLHKDRQRHGWQRIVVEKPSATTWPPPAN